MASKLGVLALALLCAEGSLAGELTVHVGTFSAGNGGSNPVSLPPVNPAEWEVEYVTDGGFVTNIAIIPGLLFGQRSEMANGIYVDMGGGLVLDINGTGPGIYSALGYTSNGQIKFNAEFKQAIGYDFSKQIAVSPHAFRLGVTFEM